MRAATGLWILGASVVLAACASCSSSSSKGGFNGDGGGSSSGGSSGGGSGGSSGGSGSGSSSGGLTAADQQACTDWAKAVCGQWNTCAPVAGIQIPYGDTATCASRMALACAPYFGAPGSGTTSTQVEACAKAVAAETCDQWLDNDQPSACAMAGTLAAGAACGTDGQCKTGYCQLSGSCGVCATRATAGQKAPDGGAVCAVDSDCAATLVCHAGSCVAPATSGKSCTMTQPCLRSLACVGGTCAAPVAVGGPCPTGVECDAAHGLICNLAKKPYVCAASTTAAVGAACGFVGGTIAVCTGGASCSNLSDAGAGTCHQPAMDGALCGTVSCMAPAVCAMTSSGAKCTLPNPSACK